MKAFPFSSQLKNERATIPGKIIKLTPIGFLVEVADPLVKVGEKFDISFELPVMHQWVNEGGVIVKLYNQFSGSGGAGLRIAEVHFRSLSSENKDKISRFLQAASKAGGDKD